MKVNEIKQLAEIMEMFHLTKIELVDEKSTINLERVCSVSSSTEYILPQPKSSLEINREVNKTTDNLIQSPMVGIFYASESPEADSFVSVGSKFKKGDVLCIIEAMKMMNEIIAEEDGEIAEVLVGNGELVEYNQPLFRLK